MAGEWKGFTEEDIGFYQKTENGKLDKVENTTILKNKAVPQRNGESKVFKDKMTKNNYPNRKQQNFTDEIPEGAKLSNESHVHSPALPPPTLTPTNAEIENRKHGNEEKEKADNVVSSSIIGSNSICLKVIKGNGYELVSKDSAEVSKATLEIFETRQRKLQEENKKKKEMLAKILSDRRKQTSEEVKRLKFIQEELQKLDLSLSNDVAILRNKIEEASLDFMTAQKRYNKAEKEFLDARQNLNVKSEKKELLTKLLCTIIEQNELRKAQKLSELMEKLEMNGDGVVPLGDCHKSSKDLTTDSVDVSKVEQPS